MLQALDSTSPAPDAAFFDGVANDLMQQPRLASALARLYAGESFAAVLASDPGINELFEQLEQRAGSAAANRVRMHQVAASMQAGFGRW